MSSSKFEIIVLEYMDLYDSLEDCKNPVEDFLMMCRKYVNPNDVEERHTRLTATMNSISYSDRSGDDKPRTVMLIGSNITAGMYTEIEEGLKQFYKSDESESESDSDV